MIMLPAAVNVFRPAALRNLTLLLRLAEPAVLGLLSYLMFVFRNAPQRFDDEYVLLTALGCVAYSVLAGVLRLYHGDNVRGFVVAFPRVLAALLGAFALVVVVLFVQKASADFSRAWLLLWLTSGSLTVLPGRAWAAHYCSQQLACGAWRRRLAVLGAGPKLHEIMRHLTTAEQPEVQLVGIYAADVGAISPDVQRHPLYAGPLESLLLAARMGQCDDVIVALDLEQEAQADKLLNTLHTLPANVFYCLPLPLFGRLPGAAGGLAHLPLALIYRRPLEGWSRHLKRVLDIATASSALVLAAPAMLGVALAVKLSSPGPVLFRQKRMGFNGQTFEMLKFRSMVTGAAAVTDASGKEQQASQTDARITPVGRFIRKTSLDELPQLINVLRGDMSLVGPRPHALSHDSYYEQLIERYASRHKMKPGLTGWAQLNGWRGETDTLDKMANRVDYDIWYIENWSLALDVRIILLTPFVLLFQKRAY
jgi:Undecaprenyl-phosphate glucose phosphotransferase